MLVARKVGLLSFSILVLDGTYGYWHGASIAEYNDLDCLGEELEAIVDIVCATNILLHSRLDFATPLGCFIASYKFNEADIKQDDLATGTLLYRYNACVATIPNSCELPKHGAFEINTSYQASLLLAKLKCSSFVGWCFFAEAYSPCTSVVACFNGVFPSEDPRVPSLSVNTWWPVARRGNAFAGFSLLQYPGWGRPRQHICDGSCAVEEHSLFAPAGHWDKLNMQTVISIRISACSSTKSGIVNGQHSLEHWNNGFHPLLCCVWTARKPACFGENEDGQALCESFIESRLMWSIRQTSHAPALLPAATLSKQTALRVDVFIRSFSKNRRKLRRLLKSIKQNWPTYLWNSTVYVMLDDSAEDIELCQAIQMRFGLRHVGNTHELGEEGITKEKKSRLISSQRFRLECIVEASSPSLETCTGANIGDMRRTGSINGGLQAMWSLLNADKHTDAEFIALTDDDVVFFTPAQPELLFDWSSPLGPRPIIMGRWDTLFVFSIIALGLDFVAEFMQSMPLIVKREHLVEVRRFIQERMRENSAEEAYCTLLTQVATHSLQRGWFHQYSNEFLSIHSVIAHYVWYRHHDHYFWSIHHGQVLLTHDQQHHSCPSLCSALHYSYSKGFGENYVDNVTRTFMKAGEWHGKLSRWHPLLLARGDVPQGYQDGEPSSLNGWDDGFYRRYTLSEACKYRTTESLLQDYSLLIPKYYEGVTYVRADSADACPNGYVALTDESRCIQNAMTIQVSLCPTCTNTAFGSLGTYGDMAYGCVIDDGDRHTRGVFFNKGAVQVHRKIRQVCQSV